MSTVCYCGQPDCPVTTWEHDACVANLRAERDALRAQVEAWKEKAKVWLMSPEAAKHLDGYRELGEKCARLEAQVEAARKVMEHALQNVKALTGGDERRMREWLDAMDEAAKK